MKKYILILPIILSIFIIGCNSSENTVKANVKETQNVNEAKDSKDTQAINKTTQEKDSINKSEDKKTNNTNSANNNVTKIQSSDAKSTKLTNSEVFFGNWQITNVIIQGKVTIYTDKDLESIIGTKLHYEADKFTFNDKVIANPKYEKNTISKEDFSSTHSNVSLESLGVNSPTVTDITVTMSDDSIIDSIGSTFLVWDNNTLIVYNGGVFFKAVRK